MIQHNATSGLAQKNVDLLPQVVVVKMGDVRGEVEVLEVLNQHEDAGLHVLALLRAQITRTPESSWMVTSPTFGARLREFGETMKESGGVPNWLVAHIVLALLDSVAYVHAAGFSCGEIGAESVVLNAYPRVLWYRYRGYPDILLSDLSASQPLSDAGAVEDAKAVLQVMQELIKQYSDTAPFLDIASTSGSGETITDDAILLILQSITTLLTSSAAPTLRAIRQQLQSRLIDIRHTGPETLPRPIARLMHSDLATNAEFEHALREPTVLRFTNKHEEYVKIVANEQVEMGRGRFAGMKTGRILVVRFGERKKGWLRIVGEDDMDDDEQMGMEEDGVFDLEDEMPEAMEIGETEYGGGGWSGSLYRGGLKEGGGDVEMMNAQKHNGEWE